MVDEGVAFFSANHVAGGGNLANSEHKCGRSFYRTRRDLKEDREYPMWTPMFSDKVSA